MAKAKVGYKKVVGNYYEVYGPGSRPTTVVKGVKDARSLVKIRRDQEKIRKEIWGAKSKVKKHPGS